MDIHVRILLLSIADDSSPQDFLALIKECTTEEARARLADAFLRKCCGISANDLEGISTFLHESDLAEEFDAEYFQCLARLGYRFYQLPKTGPIEHERLSLVAWLVNHNPSDPILLHPATYLFSDPWRNQLANVWKEALRFHPTDVRVLKNAATFFLAIEPSTAKSLVRRCQELEPSNPYWSDLYTTYFDRD